MSSARFHLQLDPRQIMRVVWICIAVLLAAHLAVQGVRFGLGYEKAKGLVPLFNLGVENNVPTWFSSVLLLAVAAVLAWIAGIEGERDPSATSDLPRAPWQWRSLAGGFLFLSLDETGSVHELLGGTGRWMSSGTGWFYFAWVLPVLVLLPLVGLPFLRFVRSMPHDFQVRTFAAAAIYLGSALGIEMAQGAYAYEHGIHNVRYMLFVTIEETLEMVGVAIFLDALLRYAAQTMSGIGLQLPALDKTG